MLSDPAHRTRELLSATPCRVLQRLVGPLDQFHLSGIV
jgi:hypothetical protein